MPLRPQRQSLPANARGGRLLGNPEVDPQAMRAAFARLAEAVDVQGRADRSDREQGKFRGRSGRCLFASILRLHRIAVCCRACSIFTAAPGYSAISTRTTVSAACWQTRAAAGSCRWAIARRRNTSCQRQSRIAMQPPCGSQSTPPLSRSMLAASPSAAILRAAHWQQWSANWQSNAADRKACPPRYSSALRPTSARRRLAACLCQGLFLRTDNPGVGAEACLPARARLEGCAHITPAGSFSGLPPAEIPTAGIRTPCAMKARLTLLDSRTPACASAAPVTRA